MDITVIGVERVAGISKAEKSFDMCNVKMLVPVEINASGKVTTEGYGFKQADFPCTVEVLAKFRDAKFPVTVTAITDVSMRYGKPQTVISDIKFIK